MATKTSSIDCTNTKFIISSHISSKDKALPKLIKSFEINNINNVISIVGGCSEECFNNNTYYVSHNSFDHTALISILELQLKSKYWFVLHDTCELGPNFYNLLSQYKIKHPYISITEMAWMNMGLFSQDFIEENKNYILSLKNLSKERAILSERVYSRFGEYGWFGRQKDQQRIRNCKNVYNDDKKRDVLYFPFLDLYKFQSYDALKVMKK